MAGCCVKSAQKVMAPITISPAQPGRSSHLVYPCDPWSQKAFLRVPVPLWLNRIKAGPGGSRALPAGQKLAVTLTRQARGDPGVILVLVCAVAW